MSAYTTSSTTRSPRRLPPVLGGLLVLLMGLAACGGDEVVVKNLYLRIASDAPSGGGKLEALSLLFSKGGAHYPVASDNPDFNRVLGALDPVAAPILVSVKYDGATFQDGKGVRLQILGKIGGAPVTRFEGDLDLDVDRIIDVRLNALPASCDADGDGFLDCATAGCCAQGTAFGDCAADSAAVNPWADEPACEPFADTADQDCDGTDVAAVDADNDQIADCFEATCGAGDPAVGAEPGGKSMPEICDDKDNDCDGSTDDGLIPAKGTNCGTGACAGGQYVCDDAGGVVCSTDNLKKDEEECGNSVDDNCNGTTDEGCTVGDFDGDGVALPADCNDFDAGYFPGRTNEPCCDPSARGNAAAEAACDFDCNDQVAFCATGDVDGDGVTADGGDCNDNDATIAPGKPERCGDGVDQDCFGGDVTCDVQADKDGDGWYPPTDCNDNDEDIAPGKAELCNGKDDDCDGLIDEGNPEGGASCGSSDVGECKKGQEYCKNSEGVTGTLTCVGNVEPVDEICDGKNNDCDDGTDEDFLYEGKGVGESCDGRGACGSGQVQCAVGRTDLATCSTNPDGAASEAETEICDTLDNDCDGELNEDLTSVQDSTCSKLGVCGANLGSIQASCTAQGTWTCNYANVPGYEANSEQSCDGKDNDCDGGSDEDLTYTEPGGSVRNFGGGCDGTDQDQCANGVVKCAAGDITKTFCDESGGAQAEVCDGLDNDCDGKTDEDFKTGTDSRVTLTNATFSGDNGKSLGQSCGTGSCGAGTVQCNPANRQTLTCVTPNQPAAVDFCDEADNDCDGSTDEDYGQTGSVKYNGGPFSGDANKYKGQTCGTGDCAGGTVVCGSVTTLTCSTLNKINTDVCNGEDDDCDGVSDDPFRAGGTTTFDGGPFSGDAGKVLDATCGTGSCANGKVICGGNTTLTCSTLVNVATDTCDNVDNNCNGTTDENFGQNGAVKLAGALFGGDNGRYKGQTCGTGSCSGGTIVCGSTTTLTCSSNSSASSELCDAVDNDCDGTSDENFSTGGDKPLAGALFSTDNGKFKNATCGTGSCTGGTVVCDADKTKLVCNSNGSASTDLCDGTDNDCDGGSDEDYGQTGTVKFNGGPFTGDANKYKGQTCGTGECAAGTVVCGTDKTSLTCSTLNKVATDVCDDKDNDCDGSVDDDYLPAGPVDLTGALFASDNGKGKGQTCGTGDCTGGTVVCGTTTTLTCSSNGTASSETCNAQDDDCDGSTDENFMTGGDKPLAGALFSTDNGKFKTATCGTGACANGTVVCSADESKLVCSKDSSATSETCNGADDNCNGTTDDPFITGGSSPLANAKFASDNGKFKTATCGTGICSGGSVVCSADNTKLVCSTDGTAVAELCDALDNDCNGTVNDPFITGGNKPLANALFSTDNGKFLTASCGTGACASGNVVCSGDKLSLVCSTNGNATTDTCNSADDNCNGTTDENFGVNGTVKFDGGPNAGDANKYKGQSCGTGACAAGTVVCQGPNNLTCSTLGLASDEQCNAIDDDCDASTDEPFKAGGTINYDDALYSGDQNLVLGDDCGTGVCDGGTIVCNPNNRMTLVCDTVVGQRQETETCDNEDEDCDGSVDETFTALSGALNTADNGKAKGATCGTGACGTSTVACNAGGTALVCPSDANATSETCNDLDDDCDASTDETFPSLLTALFSTDIGKAKNASCGTGACAGGSVECNAAGTALECDSEDLAVGSETCNGVDDTCNGTTDEGFTDTDNDGLGDCVDTCTDADADGWGRTGTTQTGCAKAGDDCNDLAGNIADADTGGGDNICVTGGVDPCRNGATTSCSDNCPSVQNATQADIDNDAIGDACDTCVDVDGDGWGRVGQNSGCAGQKANVTDCDDTAGNTADADRDNLCDAVNDTCVDADGDGWGRVGKNSGCAGQKANVTDCNDVASNTDDPDADNICTAGGAQFCTSGQTTGCKDNCPNDANPTQTDTDRDGKGDTCDQACMYGASPFEVCGDCLDNDCDGQTDEAACAERRIITVDTNEEPIAAGYPLKIVIDHANLVAAGLSTAGGNDLRIYYKDPTLLCSDSDPLACNREIDRVADPASGKGFNTTSTTIWFAAEAALAENVTTTAYELYYDIDTVAFPTPAADASAIFWMVDFFDRADSDTVGNGWVDPSATATDFGIASNRLSSAYSANGSFQPEISKSFDAISAAGTWGVWELVIGSAWVRNGEGDWLVGMQLTNAANDGAVAGETDYPNEGAGVSFAWMGGDPLGLGADTTSESVVKVGGGVGAAPTVTSVGTSTGSSAYVVTIDFETDPSPFWQIGGTSWTPSGASTKHAFTTAQTSLDTLRFFFDEVGTGFTQRAWDYVYLRPKVGTGSEPTAYLGIEEPLGTSGGTCALGTTNLVVKYRMTDTGSTLTDASGVGTALNLTRFEAPTGSPAFIEVLSHGAAHFTTKGGDGRYASTKQSNSSKIASSLHGVTAATLEVVVDNLDTATTNGNEGYLANFTAEDHTNVFALSLLDYNTVQANMQTAGGSVTWTWNLPLDVTERSVLQLVFDSSQAAAVDGPSDDRLKLYFNGALQTPATSQAIDAATTLRLIEGNGSGDNECWFTVGNRSRNNTNDTDYDRSPRAYIHWVAAYARALTAENAVTHSRTLLKSDDLP